MCHYLLIASSEFSFQPPACIYEMTEAVFKFKNFIHFNDENCIFEFLICISLVFLAVGKTSVVMRCVRNMFDKAVGTTIGAAFFNYRL